MSGISELRPYAVVVDAEGHASVWPAAREVPAGWRAVGVEGTREACLTEIERAG